MSNLFYYTIYCIDGLFRRDPRLSFFGVGRRSCAGESLARAESYLFVSGLVQRFRFRPRPGLALPPVTDKVMGQVILPKDFECVVEDRDQTG